MSGYQCMMHDTTYVHTFPSMVLWRSALRALRRRRSRRQGPNSSSSERTWWERAGDGRYGEGVDGNLKFNVHCTKLAEDAAGQLGGMNVKRSFLGPAVPGGCEEGRRLLAFTPAHSLVRHLYRAYEVE